MSPKNTPPMPSKICYESIEPRFVLDIFNAIKNYVTTEKNHLIFITNFNGRVARQEVTQYWAAFSLKGDKLDISMHKINSQRKLARWNPADYAFTSLYKSELQTRVQQLDNQLIIKSDNDNEEPRIVEIIDNKYMSHIAGKDIQVIAVMTYLEPSKSMQKQSDIQDIHIIYLDEKGIPGFHIEKNCGKDLK